jgi:exodeoxyribonuclease-5
MKAKDIKQGHHYETKIGGKLTVVKVDRINEEREPTLGTNRSRKTGKMTFEVTNLSTGRKTTFRSAAKFRREATPGSLVMEHENKRIKRLQEQVAEKVIRPTIDKLVEQGVLPKPTGEVKIEYPNVPFAEREARPPAKSSSDTPGSTARSSRSTPPSSGTQSTARTTAAGVNIAQPHGSRENPGSSDEIESTENSSSEATESSPARPLTHQQVKAIFDAVDKTELLKKVRSTNDPTPLSLQQCQEVVMSEQEEVLKIMRETRGKPELRDKKLRELANRHNRGGRRSQTNTLSAPDEASSHHTGLTSETSPLTLPSSPADADVEPAGKESTTATDPASQQPQLTPTREKDAPVVENLKETLQRAINQVTETIPEAAGLQGDQPQAFIDLTTKISDGKRVVVLCGFAGTGKTVLLTRIARWAKRQKYDVKIAAPTHKAASVISQKLASSGPGGTDIEVRTIHSMLGLRLEPDYESDSGGHILTAQDSKSKVKTGLVICDEASMVGEVLKDHIEKSSSDIIWVFVGDLAQLPPVGESISELLDEPDAVLENVLRQAQGSEILNLATRIRKGDMSMKHKKGKDVFEVADAEQLFQAALTKFRDPAYQKDPSFARMLVFKNARRQAINARMRDLLVGSQQPYEPGEWLVMYQQFAPEKSRLNLMAEEAKKFPKGDRRRGPAWKRFFDYQRQLGESVSMLHVSEEVRVVAVSERDVDIDDYTFGVWSLTVRTKDDQEYVLPVLKDEERERHSKALATIMAKAQEYRAERDECPKGSPDWIDWDEKRKKEWGRYFGMESTFAQVDYCYCMTTHKSQGSTFDHVFVDVPDLMSSGGMQQRILYTSVTRPAKSLTFYK